MNLRRAPYIEQRILVTRASQFAMMGEFVLLEDGMAGKVRSIMTMILYSRHLQHPTLFDEIIQAAWNLKVPWCRLSGTSFCSPGHGTK